MMRFLALFSLALLLSALLQAPGSAVDSPSSEGSITKQTSAEAGQVRTPRKYIESRLGGKIIKLERDPESLLRAVLFLERNGSVTQHVLKVGLNSSTDLREVKIVTPNAERTGFPPVVVIPRSLISSCWSHCKKKCGQSTNCRVRCLFDCIVS
jgi:hypothetical protein